MKLGASITLLLVLLFAAPAGAATSPNACRYSYDGLFRDMPVALNGTVTAPAEVVPGDTFSTDPGTASVELPAYLAQFGYFVGLLKKAATTSRSRSGWPSRRRTRRSGCRSSARSA